MFVCEEIARMEFVDKIYVRCACVWDTLIKIVGAFRSLARTVVSRMSL